MKRNDRDSSIDGLSAESPLDPGPRPAVLNRRDRRLMGNIAEFLGFADLMAVMMVLVTALTAVATWRTASIATQIYRASERPYMGVADLQLTNDPPGDPKVLVEYKNFGSVAAEGVVMFRRMILDGRVIGDETRRKAAGILMPDSPHRLFMHLSEESYDAVVAGRSKLRVDIGAVYQGLSRASDLCYFERFVYEPGEKLFEVDGGSPRCQELLDLRAKATAFPADQD
jgi:hypothetical protein